MTKVYTAYEGCVDFAPGSQGAKSNTLYLQELHAHGHAQHHETEGEQ